MRRHGQIIDMAVTPPTEGDSPVFEPLVDGKDLTGVTTIGDGPYDSKRCYTAVHAAGGRHLAPPKMGAMRWDRKVPAYRQRNRHIDNIHLGGQPGRSGRSTTAGVRWSRRCTAGNG